jgi:hypothetical protein
MRDLDVAKKRLYTENLTLVIVKDSKILFETNSHKISGFLTAIDDLNTSLRNASVADRVVGKAVALLFVYSKISHAYGEFLSQKAKIVLKRNGIFFEWKTIINNVLDSTQKDICPFEKVALGITQPEEAYKTFKAMQLRFEACK